MSLSTLKGEWSLLLYKGCAFLFDLALANFVHFAIIVLDIDRPFSGTYSTLNHIASLYLLVFLVRLYFVLILGVSAGQLLMGFRSTKGGFLWQRLGGLLRTAIELVLTPLFCLDAFSKGPDQDWKEFLSSTKLRLKSSKTKVVVAPLLVAASLFLFILAPLLSDFKNADGWVVSFHETNIPKLDKNSDFTSFKIHMSNRFHFKTLTSLMDGRFQIIPGFEIKKTNAKSLMTPMFSVYDTQLKRKADVRMIKRLSIEGLVKHFTKGNPFVMLSFPDLSKGFNSSLNAVRFKNQLVEWTRTSFSLNAQNIFKNPLLAPSLVEFRKYLLQQLRPGAVPEVDLVEMGNATFLRFRQNFEKHVEWSDQFVETYLPLIADEVVMWEMVWSRSLDDALSRKEFMTAFFSSAEWFYGDQDIYQLPENELDFRALMLVDFFIKKDINTKQRIAMEGYTFHLFFDLARISIANQDKQLAEIALDRIQQFNLVVKLRATGEEKFFSEQFIIQMKELYQSLKAGDKKYFGIEE